MGANQFVYYNPANGRDNISPDVYAVFDVPPHNPPKWRTWVQGKFPDIVFEITSPSTQYNDLSDAPGGKRARYALLGAREYYIYTSTTLSKRWPRRFSVSSGAGGAWRRCRRCRTGVSGARC